MIRISYRMIHHGDTENFLPRKTRKDTKKNPVVFFVAIDHQIENAGIC